MRIKEIGFFENIPVDDDTKRIYILEDSNKIDMLFKEEPWAELYRDEHCCEKMFHYLQRKESWIQYIPYDKTYAIPYHSLLSKRQLPNLKKHARVMQILNFCPFCGVCLDNEKISKLRIKKMDKYYKNHRKENEFWIDFWIRCRHTKEGKSFFSDQWRKEL
jgi:hypothetical protein